MHPNTFIKGFTPPCFICFVQFMFSTCIKCENVSVFQCFHFARLHERLKDARDRVSIKQFCFLASLFKRWNRSALQNCELRSVASTCHLLSFGTFYVSCKIFQHFFDRVWCVHGSQTMEPNDFHLWCHHVVDVKYLNNYWMDCCGIL